MNEEDNADFVPPEDEQQTKMKLGLPLDNNNGGDLSTDTNELEPDKIEPDKTLPSPPFEQESVPQSNTGVPEELS
eukprot:15363720-Ditylum_brightwellii.AAC.2